MKSWQPTSIYSNKLWSSGSRALFVIVRAISSDLITWACLLNTIRGVENLKWSSSSWNTMRGTVFRALPFTRRCSWHHGQSREHLLPNLGIDGMLKLFLHVILHNTFSSLILTIWEVSFFFFFFYTSYLWVRAFLLTGSVATWGG